MQAEPAPDTTLVEAGRRGDHAAFAQIVERYQSAVYAVSYASTRNRALADDVAQETFVAAWRSLRELRDGTRLSAWLCGIARNRARDALKRQRREHPEGADPVADEPVAASTPFDALGDAQIERLLATALDGVPAVYREPLVLFYVEQQSVADVARLLGLSPATTNKRLSRGRTMLAARIGELVESKLTLRGPKRDLVVCVLAAIAVLGSASHVDASPAVAKGSSIMPKLAVTALLVATVGGASLLSAGAGTSSKPTSARAASTAAASASVAVPAAAPKPSGSATASPPAKPAPAPTRPVTQPAPRLPAASAVPDCATVARHLAELTFYGFSSAKQMPAQKRDEFIRLRSASVAERCTTERWSDDRRSCAMGATDNDGALACREDAFITADELAKLPPELQCDAVAKHLADLATAPGAKFAIVAQKMSNAGKSFDLAKMKVQVQDQTRTKCEDLSWSVAMRRCIATSKTHDDTSKCW